MSGSAYGTGLDQAAACRLVAEPLFVSEEPRQFPFELRIRRNQLLRSRTGPSLDRREVGREDRGEPTFPIRLTRT